MLLSRLEQVRRTNNLDLELVVCDDDSADGTIELIERAALPWVRLLVRHGERCLSSAVLQGLRLARHPRLVVMDADLSHPPERIPALLAELDAGADFVIGSRYAPGGSTDAKWGFFRRMNSKIATLLARQFTNVQDPLSGFFALDRSVLERALDLDPIGYKIGLELLVKCECRRVREVPIHFEDRSVGESKLDLREQLRYIRHLRRLFIYKWPNGAYLAQFAVVGGSGTLVNVAVVTLLAAIGLPDAVAIAGGIGVSFFSNFVLNRHFTFSHARDESRSVQLAGFAVASAFGLATNYVVTLWVRREFPQMPIQIAVFTGILAGMGFNYFTSRYVVFRKRDTLDARERSA